MVKYSEKRKGLKKRGWWWELRSYTDISRLRSGAESQIGSYSAFGLAQLSHTAEL